MPHRFPKVSTSRGRRGPSPPLRAGLLAAGLVVLPALIAGFVPFAAGSTAEPRVATPLEWIMEVNRSAPVLYGTTDQRQPELFLSPTGDVVVSYLDATVPYVASFEAASLDPVLSPLRIVSETQVGNELPAYKLADVYLQNYAALDSLGRLTRIWTKSALPVSFATRVDPNGSVSLPPAYLGGVRPSTIGSLAVAIGPNDSIGVVRTDTYELSMRTELLFSRVAANGTPELGNVTIYRDGARNVKPHLLWDGPRSRFVVTWGNENGTVRLLAFDAQGTVTTGPLTLGGIGDSRRTTALPDGSLVVVWTDRVRGELRATRILANGTASRSQQLLLDGLSNPQQPFAVPGPEGSLLVMFAAGGPHSDEVHVAGFSAETLAPVLPVVTLSDDDTPASEPYGRLAADGSLWVAWVNNASAASRGDIHLSRILLRKSSLEIATASSAVEIPRAEQATVNFTVRNNGTGPLPLNLQFQLTRFSGPAGWAVNASADAGAPFEPATVLGQGQSMVLHFQVTPPVADPVGYTAFLTVGAADSRWPATSANLTVVFDVTQGHRIEVSPAYANATAAPGARAAIPFLVTNSGLFEEAPVQLGLRNGAPSGWSVDFSSTALSLAAGQQRTLWVNVTPPEDARWTDRYCDVFTLTTPTDPFASASGGYCVEADLVALPSLLLAPDQLTVGPGSTATVTPRLSLGGNAAQPLGCWLGATQALPAGWSSTGIPSVVPLQANESADVPVALRVAGDARGGLSVSVEFEVACPEGGATARATLQVVVLEVHAVEWSVPGSSFSTDASGKAAFVVTAVNRGTVDEPFA